MVALIEKLDNIPKTAHRARGATSPASAPVQLRSNSLSRIEFRRNNYDNRRRLGSCSRDPIGYRAQDPNLSCFVYSRPLVLWDPSGLKCTIWVPITHGPRGQWIPFWKETIDEIDALNPDFDTCDKIAPVCCWIKDGVRRCRYRFGDDDVIPRSWPDDWEDVIDTTKKKGRREILQIFKHYLPKAMLECCSPINRENKDEKKKCNCNECKVVFVCHPDMVPYMDDFVDAQDPKLPNTKNFCGKLVGKDQNGNNVYEPIPRVWTFDCRSKAWTDKEGDVPK